jgi:hypothetical protein
LGIITYSTAPSSFAGLLDSPVIWAGIISAFVALSGIIINNILIERQKVKEFERQREAVKNDNSFQIKKDAFLDFCATVTGFCASMRSMAAPAETRGDVLERGDFSSVGRLYMVASPDLIRSAMLLMSDIEHAHVNLLLELARIKLLSGRLSDKLKAVEALRKNYHDRIQTLKQRSTDSNCGAEVFSEIVEFEKQLSDFDTSMQASGAELEQGLYNARLNLVEIVDVHMRNVEAGLVMVLDHMRREIDLPFDAQSVFDAMKSEHEKKTQNIQTLLDRMKQ